ncbi:MAG: putative Ig domain-containing protein [Limisphaerales bacterium]
MKPGGVVPVLLLAANFLNAQGLSPNTNLNAREEQIIAATKPGAAPHFNGARVVGVRPGTPFLHSLAVSGERPMNFTAANLPAGLSLDSKTGIITGSLKSAGEYRFKAAAKNSAGKAEAEIKIICGDELVLTPPMGWNSYDAFGDNVVESEVLANARYVAAKLQPAGWDTVVVDYCWSDPGAHDNNRNARTNAPLAADNFGRLLPATNRFPSAVDGAGFKPLADAVHALGLKFGIHIMRGIPRNSVKANRPIEGSNFTAAEAGNTNNKCVWCPDMFGVNSNAAGQAWYDSCARLWAGWGVDYIKVDDLSQPYHLAEVEMVRRAIDRCGRSIVFSTSPGETPFADAAHISTHANLWRVSGDFWDNWKSLDHEFTLGGRWHDFAGPGHWPDADMLPVGHLSVGNRSVGPDRFTHLTRDEQLTHISLWSLLPSPLMVGANLPDNDDWTTALLTNPEVLAVNQDPLGKPARQMIGPHDMTEMWMKGLAGGSYAVGFFNRANQPVQVEILWRNLGFLSAPAVRDLWLRKDLGRQENFVVELPPHGCVLLRLHSPSYRDGVR